jgi:hypothetical protein
MEFSVNLEQELELNVCAVKMRLLVSGFFLFAVKSTMELDLHKT